MSRRSCWSCVLASLMYSTAEAQPAPTPAETPPPVMAPPGQESGQVVHSEHDPSTARVVARGALYVPKKLFELIVTPFRGAMWVYDRYALRDRYYRFFYNDARTFGIVPVLEYTTGFGAMAGMRLVSKDTFGDHERLTVDGSYGGTYQTKANVWLDSGERLDPVLVTVGGNFSRYARLAFYGIGNNDNIVAPPPMLIDPLVDDTAVESRYRYQELRGALTVDWRAIDDLHLIGRGAVTDIVYDPSTRDPAINEVYNPADLTRFMEGTRHLYGELEVRLDRRRIARPRWETTQYTTGWLASGFVGGLMGLDSTSNFMHYGFDMQAFMHVALGPRMFWFRLRGEGVTGELDEVPFSELPYLGGDILRGYDYGRFRDRVAVFGTAQYQWDLDRFTNAFVFVDAGRVYRGLEDLTFDHMRVGFGGGIDLRGENDFIVGITLASSIDGGVFLTARLVPLWNKVPRWR